MPHLACLNALAGVIHYQTYCLYGERYEAILATLLCATKTDRGGNDSLDGNTGAGSDNCKQQSLEGTHASLNTTGRGKCRKAYNESVRYQDAGRK